MFLLQSQNIYFEADQPANDFSSQSQLSVGNYNPHKSRHAGRYYYR